jgi:hypothetical protein
MGGLIKFNDTLAITVEQGFPADILNIEKHQVSPVKLEDVKDKIFEFHSKASARIYQPAPTRVFLVQNIDGKWLSWGKIIIIEQTITWKDEKHTTSGKYKIIYLNNPEYQKIITKNESPEGKSYF